MNSFSLKLWGGGGNDNLVLSDKNMTKKREIIENIIWIMIHISYY